MNEIVLSRMKRVLKSKKNYTLPLSFKNINYMLYVYRYHNVLPQNDSKQLIALISKKLEKTSPALQGYGVLLETFCKIASIRQLSDISISKFQDYFLKYEGKLSLKALISISFFLNFSKNEDLECYKQFNSFFLRSLDEMPKYQQKPRYFLSLLRYFFKKIELQQENLKLVLEKFILFQKNMTVSEVIRLFWLFPRTDN